MSQSDAVLEIHVVCGDQGERLTRQQADILGEILGGPRGMTEAHRVRLCDIGRCQFGCVADEPQSDYAVVLAPGQRLHRQWPV
ncbi:hypothetical protein [Nocardia nova]|uniref:hypothetical protein n=1 Tax=Nocardia nova TaxID=37330 RepID=UPI0025B035E3|nr:hypothetical protein [Nocardia nova]